MANRISRFAAGAAMAACVSMAATPALADGGWGGGGWGGGGWGGRHHDHDDAGWIIGGIIGIAAIAAIASSASNKSKRDRDARDRDYHYPDRDSRDDGYRGEPRSGGYGERRDDGNRPSWSGRGIDGAVDTCVAEVEHGSTRVDTVDSVDRDGDGWRIEGHLGGGKSFVCSVANTGRIRSVTVDGKAALYQGAAPANGAG